MFVMQEAVAVAVAALLSGVSAYDWRDNLKPLKASGMDPMTKDKLTLVQYAADMSLLSYEPYMLAELFDDPRIIDDSVSYPESLMKYHKTDNNADAIILDDREGYCTIAWRGTENEYAGIEWRDQNLNLHPETVGPDKNGVDESLDSRTCVVHQGFYEAYSGLGGSEDPQLENYIKEFVEQCMDNPDNPDKQLVFTGHSQGGASAGVASIIFANFHPLAITFGQPPLGRNMLGCELINADHLWRFINSEDDGRIMQYDPVPCSHIIPGFGDHIGPSIILPPASADAQLKDHQTSVRYYSKTQPDLDVSIFGMDIFELFRNRDGIVSAHRMGTDEIRKPGYKEKIDFLLENLPDGENLDISGFPKGDLCNRPEDCQTGRCDWDSYNPFTLRKTCLDKVGTSERCNENSDCINGECAVGGGACINLMGVYCCAGVPNSVDEGDICHRDIDCKGGRCERTNFGGEKHCKAKVGFSEGCNEDDDCISNDCAIGGGNCGFYRMCCNANSGSIANGKDCDVDRECASGSCECEGFWCRNRVCK